MQTTKDLLQWQESAHLLLVSGKKYKQHHQMLLTGGTRGVLFGGGYTPSATYIDYANIDSTGDTISFGNLGGIMRVMRLHQEPEEFLLAETRTYTYKLCYTIASTGDSTQFGDILLEEELGGLSNSTRGIMGFLRRYPVYEQIVIDYM